MQSWAMLYQLGSVVNVKLINLEEVVIVAVKYLTQTEQIAQRTILVHLEMYAAPQDNANRNQAPLVKLGIFVFDLSPFNSNDVDLLDIF